jgi:hypothetical protein
MPKKNKEMQALSTLPVKIIEPLPTKEEVEEKIEVLRTQHNLLQATTPYKSPDLKMKLLALEVKIGTLLLYLDTI